VLTLQIKSKVCSRCLLALLLKNREKSSLSCRNTEIIEHVEKARRRKTAVFVGHEVKVGFHRLYVAGIWIFSLKIIF